jgi:histidyl-tRNA synthetase
MRYTGSKIPATGASVGVDRLIAALEKLGKIEKVAATAKVLLTLIDEELMPEVFVLAQKIRQTGVNAEIYLGTGSLKEQIRPTAKQPASRQNQPFHHCLSFSMN